MTLLTLFAIVLIVCVTFWVTKSLVFAFKVEDPLATIIYVAVVLILLFLILQWLGVSIPLINRPLR